MERCLLRYQDNRAQLRRAPGPPGGQQAQSAVGADGRPNGPAGGDCPQDRPWGAAQIPLEDKVRRLSLPGDRLGKESV